MPRADRATTASAESAHLLRGGRSGHRDDPHPGGPPGPHARQRVLEHDARAAGPRRAGARPRGRCPARASGCATQSPVTIASNRSRSPKRASRRLDQAPRRRRRRAPAARRARSPRAKSSAEARLQRQLAHARRRTARRSRPRRARGRRGTRSARASSRSVLAMPWPMHASRELRASSRRRARARTPRSTSNQSGSSRPSARPCRRAARRRGSRAHALACVQRRFSKTSISPIVSWSRVPTSHHADLLDDAQRRAVPREGRRLHGAHARLPSAHASTPAPPRSRSPGPARPPPRRRRSRRSRRRRACRGRRRCRRRAPRRRAPRAIEHAVAPEAHLGIGADVPRATP